MAKVVLAEIERVDRILAVEKRLGFEEPKWHMMQNGRWSANWPVIDDLDSVVATLSFRLDPKYRDYPSISMIVGGNCVCRLDLAPIHMVKPNPPWAINCAPSVKGSHFHSWEDHRDRILVTGLWRLQARREVENAMKRIPQMLRWFADRVNIRLEGNQYNFDFTGNINLYGEETL